MSNEANAIFLLVALFLFMLWFYGPWQTQCVDWARRKMFESRNAIFDMAADGKVSFDSREYRQIRLAIETLIRFTHHVSWPRLVFFAISRRFIVDDRSSVQDVLDTRLGEIKNDSVRNEMVPHITVVKDALVYSFLSRSVVLMVVSALFMAALYLGVPIYVICKRLSDAIFDAIQRDAQALDRPGGLGGSRVRNMGRIF